jgi:alpha-tubulin suppressor-like RCC1 family protein
LANGTTFSSPQLRAIGGLSGVVLIASGDYHGLALKNDGTLLAWGYNASGQLGDGTDANPTLSFSNVSGLTQVESIAAGANHSVARKSDGTVWAWGLNNEGQVGNGTATLRYLTPTLVTGLSGVTAIASGSRHMALLADNTCARGGAAKAANLATAPPQRASPVIINLGGVVAMPPPATQRR